MAKSHSILLTVGALALVLGLASVGTELDANRSGVSADTRDWQLGEPQSDWRNNHQKRTLPDLQDYALEVVNRDRQLNGLSPLQPHPLLMQVSQAHATDMLKRGFYDHVNPEGQNPSDRLKAAGGKTGAGENIMEHEQGVRSLTYGLLEDYQESWMHSDGHRQNLLKPDYQYFGFGIVASPIGDQVYAVQMFSRSAP